MMIPIGHKNFVESANVLTILRPDSAPAKRLRRSAAESGTLVNATNGRTASSLIVLDTNHIVLSVLTVKTIKSRFKRLNPSEENRMPALSEYSEIR